MYFPKTGLFLSQTYPLLFHKQKHWVLTDIPICMSQTYTIFLFFYSFSYVIITLCHPLCSFCLSNSTGYKSPVQYYPTWMLFHQCSPHWLIPLLILLSNPCFGIILSPVIWFHSTHTHWTHTMYNSQWYKNFQQNNE